MYGSGSVGEALFPLIAPVKASELHPGTFGVNLLANPYESLIVIWNPSLHCPTLVADAAPDSME